MTEVEKQIQLTAEAAMREKPAERVLSITVDGETYWIKRKMGNGRAKWVKYSVEKEFYYEIARMTIAGKNCPDLVPELVLLKPDYMVTRDGGDNIKSWLDKDISEEEKEILLERAGASLATLHEHDIVHGRPALRDMTWNGEKLAFLDWENRMYSKDLEEQKAIDFLLLLHGLCREDYKEEAARVHAICEGYRMHQGEAVYERAKMFLMKHSMVGMITEKLAPFHMVDVESVWKLYGYLLKSSEK